MILSETVEMNWNNKTKKHYESKGYVFTGNKDAFQVKVEDLLPTSKKRVEFKCDYCGIIGSKNYVDLLLGREIVEKDSCKKCRYTKVEESNLIVYGGHPQSTEEVKQKQKNTIIEKYGVENYTQTEEYHIKRKTTSLFKYGTEYPVQAEEVKLKVKTTNLERYGAENYTQTQDYLEKTRATNLRKYGVENVMQNSEIKARNMESLYQNGTAPCSQQQALIHTLVGGELNYPVGNCFLDIALLDDKIYLEYDGGGHDLQVKYGVLTKKQFEIKERKRSLYLVKTEGWKEVRIVSSDDKLPSNQSITTFVNKARQFLNNGHGFSVIWNLNENTVTLNYKNKYDIKDFLDNILLKLEKEVV